MYARNGPSLGPAVFPMKILYSALYAPLVPMGEALAMSDTISVMFSEFHTQSFILLTSAWK